MISYNNDWEKEKYFESEVEFLPIYILDTCSALHCIRYFQLYLTRLEIRKGPSNLHKRSIISVIINTFIVFFA